MPKPTDDERVQIRYSSLRNISFHGTVTLETTWGEWRAMDSGDQDAVLSEAAHQIIDITVVGE